MAKKRGVYWLKRDFRLLDNPALSRCLKECDEVIVLYIIEPSFHEAEDIGPFHYFAIQNAFNDLRRQFLISNIYIHHAEGTVIAILSELQKKWSFNNIYSHEEIGVDWTYQRDLEVGQWCSANEIGWIEEIQTGVFRRLNNRNKRARLWKKFYTNEILPRPSNKMLEKVISPKETSTILKSNEMTFKPSYLPPDEVSKNLQTVSEGAAHETLQSFHEVRGIAYSGGISSPLTAFDAGSRLSVHLAWGTISGRYVYQKNLEKKLALQSQNPPDRGLWIRSLNAFQARLHWRDHFIQRLETEPQMEFQALNTAYEEVAYSNNPSHIKAWTTGFTGYPMVDACIRCLLSTGFVNFRMRAMITSFACHVLHLDWKVIHPVMSKMYTDYEPGIHISQLQMQAGVVGINTIRIYSPTKQIKDHDPECLFVKQFVPELRIYTPRQIIGHVDKPLDGYTPPIVDYSEKSKEMRSMLWTIKGKKETKALAAQVYEKHGSRKGPSRKRKSNKP
ncbi:cryptochrome/deoxyribodipyrimidine photo-lyase family protein [Portibacter marinus]|uniref:cryptochrome/deoxyribodipyrimidine photo-lyase family protein n=1 Tax=Portibacter marinus TaxID=2898660 RepID=UPI001F26E5A8|nr:FAD-binding domain-containing protein [Portibacter marinus]